MELPIPQIFLIENADGVLELIDGLQRVSSIIQFMNPDKINHEELVLEGCDLVPELNGLKFEDLPLKLRLQLKRSAVRAIIIKRQSKAFLRYEMFKRLNTGGSTLSHQEIRNCSARMVDEGTMFYEFLQELAKAKSYRSTIQSLSQADAEQRMDEELVLRYFALKNDRDRFRGSVRDWLDAYMEDVIFDREHFDYDEEGDNFRKVFRLIDKALGDGAFVKYRSGNPIGSLAPAYFEAVTMGVYEAYDHVLTLSKETVQETIAAVLESKEFKSFTGPGANTKPKMRGRIRAVKEALLAA